MVGFQKANKMDSKDPNLKYQHTPTSQISGPKPDATDLPLEKVFPIQIGTKLFRLSGASISSDAPSYFSNFFEEQLKETESGGSVRTLYIDRDPVTFEEISRHLQGYHVNPKDGMEFVKLFADAQFYSLPRLISQLFESEIFIQIGERNFQIPRDVFSDPGNSPNFFSLGYGVFFASPAEVFPGLSRDGLLRPPSIVPPSVPARSGDVFGELLHLLRGYPLRIKNEDHRTELLRDCRYFHLRGLEQKLIPHEISYNLERERSEIVVRLEDIRQSGLQFISDSNNPTTNPSSSLSSPESQSSTSSVSSGWVHYARPFVDDNASELIVEIGGESMRLDLDEMNAEFHGLTKARISSLVQVVANKMNLPTDAPLGLIMMAGNGSSGGSRGGSVNKQQSTTPATAPLAASPGHSPLSGDRPRIAIDRETDVILNGLPYSTESLLESLAASTSQSPSARPAKRKRTDGGTLFGEMEGLESPSWIVRKGQWRLRVQPRQQSERPEIIFVAVKLDVFTNQKARNQRRKFLS